MAASVQLKSVNDWHAALIEYIISNPTATLRDKAQVFGVTQSWLSIVENSDSFKEQMKLRRDEHFGNMSNRIVQKLEATAEIALEEITRRMEKDSGSAIPFNNLRDVSDMALKHLGFGQKSTPAVGSNVTNNTVIIQDREALAEARAMMAARRTVELASDAQIIEGELSAPANVEQPKDVQE